MQGEMQEKEKENLVYKVKKNDILYIQISSSDENVQKIFTQSAQTVGNQNINNQNLYFRGYIVDKEGFVALPFLGKIHVAGLSFEEIKTSINKALLNKNFKSTDNIFIKVKLAGVPYTILGEVKNPQVGVIYKENPSLFDVIAASGDITQVGNRKEVLVIRKENGKDVKALVDLTSANSINSPYFYIRPNDIVYVQPLRQKSLGTGTTLLQTLRDTVMALSLISSIILLAKYSK
jgi:polysaccharide export outer membrane protein